MREGKEEEEEEEEREMRGRKERKDEETKLGRGEVRGRNIVRGSDGEGK